jgi:hypothetical protein
MEEGWQGRRGITDASATLTAPPASTYIRLRRRPPAAAEAEGS